jgi:two-component system, LuxR family, sensor kinase FixL
MAISTRSLSCGTADGLSCRASVPDELTRQAFEGVFVVQKERVVYCNSSFARMAGYRVEEIRKWSRRRLQSLVHPDDRARIRQQYADRLRGRSAPSDYDCRMIKPDGRVIWVRSYVGMIEYQGQPALHLACIDITERKELEEELFRAGLDERQRIGQDIHDTLGQQLAGIGYLCHSLKKRLQERSAPEADDISFISRAVAETLALVRQLSRGLIPFSIAEEGLCNALRRMAMDASRLFSTPCRLSCGWSEGSADEMVAANLYHIAQEAVNNAMRHGKPARVSVRLSAGRTRGRLTVADDGKPPPAKPGTEKGMWLRIMRHRVEMIGGQLTVERSAGCGTTVTCSFPLTRKAIRAGSSRALATSCHCAAARGAGRTTARASAQAQ